MVNCNFDFLKGHEQLLKVIDVVNTKVDIQATCKLGVINDQSIHITLPIPSSSH